MKKAPYDVPESKKIRVIIDTDCANEADDQYALSHALMTPKFDVVGVTAAHYGDRNGTKTLAYTAGRSYDECFKVLEMMGLENDVKLFHGCEAALPDEKTPVDSDASRFIVDEAMRQDSRPLFVAVLGAITNVASAYLMEPEIADKLTVIWIGGGAYPGVNWEFTFDREVKESAEFNMSNDVNAANVMMDSPIELWQVPENVYSMMKVSFAELYEKVYPCGELGKYIVDYMINRVNKGPMGNIGHIWIDAGYSPVAARCMYPGGESWQLGDSPAIGLMLTDHQGHYTMEPAPRFDPSTFKYLLRPGNPRKIRVYNYVDSRFILEDFFAKIKYYFG